jgi:hypothetical protein
MSKPGACLILGVSVKKPWSFEEETKLNNTNSTVDDEVECPKILKAN